MLNCRRSPSWTTLLSTLLVMMGGTCSAWGQTTRVLIVGDSWAQQQWDDDVHEAVFDVNGFPDIVADGSVTAVSGSTAADWTAPDQLEIITDALVAQPDIDIVQITLGGNDFLDAWNVDLSAMAEIMLQEQIRADLDTIISAVLAVRSDIEVVLSFYDYPNFVDTLTGLSGQFCEPLHTSMGMPTPEELNAAAGRFESVYASLATTDPRVHHVSHFGLMQFTYGFPSQGIAPGDLLPPGDITRPSPTEAMRLNLGFILDCFHLSPEGYDVLIQNLFDQYFRSRFSGVIFESGFESP